MRNNEIVIFLVVAFFSLVTYYLVEPYAHHVLHKHVESEGYAYDDLRSIRKTGDVTRGEELVMGAGACVGCHSIESVGMPASMTPHDAAAAYGVNPPDLSNVGVMYDARYLADAIKDPSHAMMNGHMFDASKGEMHPMPPFYGAGGNIDQEIADMVAYLQSISVKEEDITPKMAYENACGRCHALKYEKWTQIGNKPMFKDKKDDLMYEINFLKYKESITGFMGKLPPDLSMYIRSRGEGFMKTFIENPQAHLPGTSMPRVGVTEETADKVIEYLKDSGDNKREEREEIGKMVMIYIVIFAIFALLWKKQVWRDLH